MGVFKGVQYKLTYEDRVKGGKSKSLKKLSTAKVNSLKDGKTSKDPRVIKLVTQTSEEKLLGIEPSDKIKQLKKLNPLFGTTNKLEYLFGVKEFLGELMISALKKKQAGKSTDYEYRQLTKLTLELYDRLFGKTPDTVVNIANQNIQPKITFKQLHQQILEFEREDRK